MNTLKSGALIVVLLVVLYGVFVALSKPDRPPLGHSEAQNDEDLAPPLIDYSTSDVSAAEPAPTPLATPSVPGHNAATSPADPSPDHALDAEVYESQSTSTTLPPPTAPLPSDSTLGAADRYSNQRSSYEYSPPVADNAASASPADDSASNATEPASPSAPVSSATDSGTTASLAAWSLKRDLQQAEQLVAGHRFREALTLLTPYHAQEALGSEERAVLAPWLDALAAKIIYSREHVLAMPHKVRNTESLFDIAGKYGVGWQLLQNINGLTGHDPRVLVPGTELKVLPGPFRADVSLPRSELTLYLDELYAGRFPLTIGNEPPPPGAYKVVDKREDRTYIGIDGRTIAANDPANPYGGCWISLGGEVSIHGSPLSPPTQTLGCISLSPRDAKDVYGILTVGSEVTIRR